MPSCHHVHVMLIGMRLACLQHLRCVACLSPVISVLLHATLAGLQSAIAMVNLVGESRQWSASVKGPHPVAPILHQHDMDRNESFCAWALMPRHPEVLLIEDVMQDSR